MNANYQLKSIQKCLRLKKLRINGLVNKSFPGKKHVRIQKGGGGVGPDPPPEKSQKYRVS